MESLPKILSMIGTVILMIAVFVGAYYASKFVGKHYKPRYSSSKNMTVIESTSVGKDSVLLLVKVANRVFFVGATPHEFTLLSELSAEEVAYETESVPTKKDFSSIMNLVLKGKENTGNEGEHK